MSFDQLLLQYEPLIHRVMNTLHVYRNKEEYYQVGLIALWEAERSFSEEKGAFLPYAYTVIRGRMLDFLKKQKKYESETPTTCEEQLEGSYEMNAFDTLQEYVALLTPKQQKWLLYTYEHDYSLKQIAALEQTTVEAVKSWRKQALKKIRNYCIMERDAVRS